MCNVKASWKMLSLGMGFYQFNFDIKEYRNSVWSIGSWNLKPGLKRLFGKIRFCSGKKAQKYNKNLVALIGI